ncbi:hypothetical protein D4764_0169920 [Takifugu flavidus]|uniref:Uncharacterized protein n=1 Tax=Takifugu flavidus TaxID=433684 RepID=A0A5C6MEP3_9TELE|nr:hypothetical protein D4764_0169920 [Takifugu flavidus]
MSKLLMAIELGTDSYKGKSLDEIDLSLEIASSEPSGDAGEGPALLGSSMMTLPMKLQTWMKDL